MKTVVKEKETGKKLFSTKMVPMLGETLIDKNYGSWRVVEMKLSGDTVVALCDKK